MTAGEGVVERPRSAGSGPAESLEVVEVRDLLGAKLTHVALAPEVLVPVPAPDTASRGQITATVPDVEFSRELRNDVLAGDITLSVRLWKQPRVKQGGRYRVGLGMIEVDEIELIPFAAVTGEDVRRAGEPDRETLRQRAAHAGPIGEDTLVYRIEFHTVGPGD
jgi:hypothetical protein